MVVSKEQQDYYRILGVNKGCLDNEIKKSYYKLAKKWHPDKNGSPLAEEKFKEINKAYEILSDDKKRSTYDSQYTGRSDILTRTSSYSAKTRSTYTPKSANFTFFTNTSANNDSFNMDYDAKWRAFTNANNFYDQTRTTENPFAKFTNNFKPEYNIPPFTSPKFSRESFYKGFKKYFEADYSSTESDDDSDSVIIEDFYNELSKNAKKSKSERSKNRSSSSKWKKNWDDMNKKNSPRNGSNTKSNSTDKPKKKSNIPEPPQNDFKFNPEHPLNGFKFNSKSDPFELLETFAMYKLFSEMSHRLFKDVDDEEMLINLAKIISSFNLPPKNKMNTSPMNSFRKQNNPTPTPQQKPQPTSKPSEKPAPPKQDSSKPAPQPTPEPKPTPQSTTIPTNITKTSTNEKSQEKKNSDFVFSETIRRKKEENDAKYERSRSNATPSPTESSHKPNNNSWEFEWMGKKQAKKDEHPESSNTKIEEEIFEKNKEKDRSFETSNDRNNQSDSFKPIYSKYDDIFNHNSTYNTKQFECQYCFKRMSDKEDLLSHQLICKRLSQNRLKTKYYSTKLPNNDYYPSKDYTTPTSTTTPMTECAKCNISMTTYDYLMHHCETPRSNYGNESARKNLNSAASNLSSSQSFKYPYRARPTLDSKLSSRRSFDSTTPGSAGTSRSGYTSSASPRQPLNTPSDFVFSKLRAPLSANKKQYPDIASPPTTKSQYIPSSSKRHDTENNQPIKPVIKTNFSFNNPIKKTSLFNGVPTPTGTSLNSNSTYGGVDNQYSPSAYRAALPQQSFTAAYTKPYSSFSSPSYSKSSKLVSNASFSGLGSTKYYPFNSSYTGLKREKLRTGF